jgi:hypothetical protein
LLGAKIKGTVISVVDKALTEAKEYVEEHKEEIKEKLEEVKDTVKDNVKDTAKESALHSLGKKVCQFLYFVGIPLLSLPLLLPSSDSPLTLLLPSLPLHSLSFSLFLSHQYDDPEIKEDKGIMESSVPSYSNRWDVDSTLYTTYHIVSCKVQAGHSAVRSIYQRYRAINAFNDEVGLSLSPSSPLSSCLSVLARSLAVHPLFLCLCPLPSLVASRSEEEQRED